jgi:hypothetical protein
MQAEILALDRLDDLVTALATFASKAADALTAMREEFLRQQRDLDEREEEARGEVRYCAEALQLAELAEDDSERESCAYSLAEARERLGRIRSWQARVREESSAFAAQETRFERLLDQTLPKGQEFLTTRIDHLRAYGAVQLELGAGAATPGPVSEPAPLSAGAVGGVSPPDPEKLTDHPLPDGFVWVPLAEINETRLAEITSEADYKKGVSYATMLNGLRRLATEILPRLRQDPNALGLDSFRSLDKEAGESFENGLERIYEAFFCKDYIYLERPRGEEKFGITNGRHRIRVAQDLGWEAIPARIKDLRS